MFPVMSPNYEAARMSCPLCKFILCSWSVEAGTDLDIYLVLSMAMVIFNHLNYGKIINKLKIEIIAWCWYIKEMSSINEASFVFCEQTPH